jgi:predicted TIM-barrel fold metal-dependent hydrolase
LAFWGVCVAIATGWGRWVSQRTLAEAVRTDALLQANVTPLARALVAHAPQRLVWGSDWPHVNMNDRLMPNDGDLVDLISEWIPDAATCRRILVDNACELYGFPKPG